jgi:ADP-heptose:LPS heptosyltransferase
MLPQLKTDCRFFKGAVPCAPHKNHGVHCVEETGAPCRFYDPIDRDILIIKLGALGDVIRTTPLLHRLKSDYPHARITWVTLAPEILPSSAVDRRLEWNLTNLTIVRSLRFDIVYNLDKDLEACALCDQVQATTKRGFTLKGGVPSPIDPSAEHKFLTGVFDDVSKANTKSYPQEIFEICGFRFNGERYILDHPPAQQPWNISRTKPVIGLNTGCGERWTSRLWADKNWVALAKTLRKRGYEVVLLGGKQEHSKNLKLARASGAKYFGHFPLTQFMNLVDQCDLVVTAVTMAMHITIGLGKKIVLINNIFNKHEFELYDQGVIVEPQRPCHCFYKPTCTNAEYRCMDYVQVSQVLDGCQSLIPAPKPRTRSRR